MTVILRDNNRPSTSGTWDRPADRARASAESSYAAIRANTDLTPTAMQRGLAKAYLKAKTDIETLAGNAGQQTAATLAAAKRAMFGIDDVTKRMSPAEQTAAQQSFRDAQQRAATLATESEALGLLDTANNVGDELLARAIGNAALTNFAGWPTVAERYFADRPDKAAAWQRMTELGRPAGAATLFEFAVPRPGELAGLSDGQITTLADS